MKAPKNRKAPETRSVVTYGMIIRCKGSGPMKHRTAPRGGAKNKQTAFRNGEY